VVDKFLPTGKLSSLYGDGGVGKSLLSMFIAGCVSTGVDVFGMHVNRGHVIYLDGEDDEDEFRRRIQPMAAAHGFHGVLGYYQVTMPINQAFINDLGASIVQNKTVLVVVDSFSALSGGNLDNETVMRFMGSFRQLGVAILFIDHEPKYNDSQLGPNSKKNQSRAQYHLEEYNGGALGQILKLTQTKSNIGDFTQPIYIKITSVPDTINPKTISLDRVFPVPGGHGSTVDTIVECVRRLKSAQSASIVIDTGLTEGAVATALSRLVRDGKLTSDGLKPATYSIV
jgi:RecA-family ATPase